MCWHFTAPCVVMFKCLVRWRPSLVRLFSSSARTRYRLSSAYLTGQGIEIGALHNPLPVGRQVKVKYIDRLSRANLLQQYPELAHQNIVNPDIIDDGERLFEIRNESLDFIIANHFIEHCENPIATLVNFFSRLKPGGVVYLAVPDKRFTFDRQRGSTSLAHLQNDFGDGGSNSREAHYRDFAKYSLLKGAVSEDEVTVLARQLIEKNYSIHFHVWTQDEFLDFLQWLKTNHLRRLEIIESRRNHHEGIFILRKQAEAS